MAEPEHDHVEGFEVRRPPGVGPAPPSERPEWLVGADEVLETARPDPPGRPAALPSRAAAAPAGVPSPQAWKAAASSVPRLKTTPPPDRRHPGEAGVAEEDLESPPKPSSPARGEGPALPSLKPLEEPWWLVLAERLAGDRRVVIGGLALLLVGGGAALWRGRDRVGVSLAAIKRHAPHYEGRRVTVRGKVGEVFEIGQGYVFWLHQGRDTVAVFSPARRPRPNERVTVAGTITTGYLDGVPRVALFEIP